jgi:hypothetical protein
VIDAPWLLEVFVHEAAHLVVAEHFGCSSNRITLTLADGEIGGSCQLGEEAAALTPRERRIIALAGRSAVSALVDMRTNIEAIAALPLSAEDALNAGAHSFADVAAATDLSIKLAARIFEVAVDVSRQAQEQLERVIAARKAVTP